MRRATMGLLLGALTVGGVALAVHRAAAQERGDQDLLVAPEPPGFSRFSGGGSFLGVVLSEVDSDAVARLKLDEERGALVRRVVKQSPAESAGLKKDDVLLSWNGTRLESAAQLTRIVHETPAGRTVHLGVARDGKKLDVNVELGERKGLGTMAFAPGPEFHERMQDLGKRLGRLKGFHFDFGGPGASIWVDSVDDGQDIHVFMSSSGRGRMGVAIENLSSQLARYFGLKDGSGVLISSVRKDSPAEKAGLRAGDVIVSVGSEKVEDPGDVMRLVARADKGPIEVRIVRDKKERTVSVDLGERQRGGHFFFRPDGEATGLGEKAALPQPHAAPRVLRDIALPHMLRRQHDMRMRLLEPHGDSGPVSAPGEHRRPGPTPRPSGPAGVVQQA